MYASISASIFNSGSAKLRFRENFDPLGVHTGDSIVIAPSQTLSDEVNHPQPFFFLLP